MGKGKRKSSLVAGLLLSTVGGIFVALGIALLVIIIKEIIESGEVSAEAGIIMPIIIILALLGLGTTALIMGGKNTFICGLGKA